MTAPESEPSAPVTEWTRWLYMIPVFIFGLLAILFYWALQLGDPTMPASTMIGKPAPAFELAGIAGMGPGLTSGDLKRGEVSVVNVWATWCVPCHEEHPQLIQMKQLSGVRLYGIVYKDKAIAVRNFLGRAGNPYDGLGDDASGRAGIDWGVSKVPETFIPETFIVDGTGRIVYKESGPITKEVLQKKILPAIDKVRRRSTAARQQG
jgi:cytochrome c biogenesis protein CcmG/thiol:disulfide interchange protein DsbE